MWFYLKSSARWEQRRESAVVGAAQTRLGGILFDAEERMRSRVTSEIHDDSQRLAVIA